MLTRLWGHSFLSRNGRIHRRFRDYTMTTPSLYRANLELAEMVTEIPGCIIECGVWRGGMMAGIASVLGNDRRYFLFDSFEGLPEAQEIDGATAIRWQQDKSSPQYLDNCRAEATHAEAAMALAGVTDFELIHGWFNETIPNFEPPEAIALLRLDGDWYESTMTCLMHLFDYVAPGGIVIIDDYFAWDGCSRAVHDFLSKRSAVERLNTHGSVCFIRRQPKGEA